MAVNKKLQHKLKIAEYWLPTDRLYVNKFCIDVVSYFTPLIASYIVDVWIMTWSSEFHVDLLQRH